MNAIDWSAPARILARQRSVWNSEIVLEQSLIETKEPPPRALVTSARAVVIHDTNILVLSDMDGARHVVPGGRIAPGETWSDTIKREVREETRLAIQIDHQIAVIASTHQRPCPSDYRYPYPTFLQVVYLARADAPARLHVEDEWVANGAFVPLQEAGTLVLPPIQEALVTLVATELNLASLQPPNGPREKDPGSRSGFR